MKLGTRNSKLFFTALFLLLAQAKSAATVEVPPLRGRVNDLGGLISPERARRLEARLQEFESETGHQIAVLTIPSLGGEDIEGFGIRVADAWKIGQKGFDNGVILIVVKDDRKLRIEVGYGLEGVLPDALASRIIREVIVPRFRENDFAGGIEAGIEAISKTVRGESMPLPRDRPQNNAVSLAQLFFILFLVIIPLFALGGTRNQRRSLGTWSGSGRRRSRDPFGSGTFWGGYGGGGFGGTGGGFSGGGGGFGGGGASGRW